MNCLPGDAAVIWRPGSDTHGHAVFVIETLVPGNFYRHLNEIFQAPEDRRLQYVRSPIKFEHLKSGLWTREFIIYDDMLRTLCGHFGKESPNIYDVSPTKYMESK